RLVRRYLLPQLATLKANAVSRDDLQRTLNRIEKPVLANQVMASASAVFSWAIGKTIGGVTMNPCQGIERNKVSSRERGLSDSELPLFWNALDQAGLAGKALKLILLTGQRPGEVRQMRCEHVVDGWWEMLGKPVAALGWPGTKNAENHRVWLPQA